MPVLLPVEKVLSVCNPFKHSPWGDSPVTRQMVSGALRVANYDGQFRNGKLPVEIEASANAHAARIAYLVQYGWEDAIVIDVGIPSLGGYVAWPVVDGNHRLAAAGYRGDATILTSVSGCLDHAFELFGVDCLEPEEYAP